MINFAIETNILRGLLHVAPKKDGRFFLRAIHLDFRRGFAVANLITRMARHRMRDGEGLRHVPKITLDMTYV